MNDSSPRLAATTDGVPAAYAVPTATPIHEAPGLLPVLALVVAPDVDQADVDRFLGRFHFVPGDQTARAGDSDARWTVERDGRVTVTFLDEIGASRIVIPADARFLRWGDVALRACQGTVAIMVFTGMTTPDLLEIGRRISAGHYWHLSSAFAAA